MNPYVTKRLNEIRAGVGNWDGLKRPHRKTCDHADQFAHQYFTQYIPTPSVVPTERGSILFVFTENDLNVEIEIHKRDIEIRHAERKLKEVR